MVNVGDTVSISFSARASFSDFQPIQSPDVAMRSRLEAAGFKVLKIDLGEAGLWTSIESALSLGYAGYFQAIVIVQPYSSAYAQPQDIAGIVAGAAEAAGLQVDQPTATAQIVGYANPTTGQPSSTGYLRNQTDDDPKNRRSFLDDLADAFGVSKSTLELIATGLIVAGAAVVVTRK